MEVIPRFLWHYVWCKNRNDSSINIKIKNQNIWEEGFDVKPVESNELKFTKSLKTFGNSWLSKSFGLSANAMGTRQQLPELSSSLIWKSSDVFLHYFFKAYFLFFLQFAYLIFVIFFTLAKFLENKIYTEKRQFFALNL